MHENIQDMIHHGYILLFLWMFSERLGIPIPATLPLIAAVMLADFAWFFLSRIRGLKVLSFLCRISLEPDACVRKNAELICKTWACISPVHEVHSGAQQSGSSPRRHCGIGVPNLRPL